MRNWLKELRVKAGLTQLEVARQLNISESYYSLIESGARKKDIGVSLIVKMSQIFNVPIEEIIETSAEVSDTLESNKA